MSVVMQPVDAELHAEFGLEFLEATLESFDAVPPEYRSVGIDLARTALAGLLGSPVAVHDLCVFLARGAPC